VAVYHSPREQSEHGSPTARPKAESSAFFIEVFAPSGSPQANPRRKKFANARTSQFTDYSPEIQYLVNHSTTASLDLLVPDWWRTSMSSSTTTGATDTCTEPEQPEPAHCYRFANRLLALLVQHFGHHAEVKDELVEWASGHKHSKESYVDEETITAAYRLGPSEINFGQLEPDTDYLAAKVDAIIGFANAEASETYREAVSAFREDLRRTHAEARETRRERRRRRASWRCPPKSVNGWERAVHRPDVATYQGCYRGHRAEILIQRESDAWFADVHTYPARDSSSGRLRGVAVAKDSRGQALARAVEWIESYPSQHVRIGDEVQPIPDLDDSWSLVEESERGMARVEFIDESDDEWQRHLGVLSASDEYILYLASGAGDWSVTIDRQPTARDILDVLKQFSQFDTPSGGWRLDWFGDHRIRWVSPSRGAVELRRDPRQVVDGSADDSQSNEGYGVWVDWSEKKPLPKTAVSSECVENGMSRSRAVDVAFQAMGFQTHYG